MSITKGECLKHIRELTRENNSLKQKINGFERSGPRRVRLQFTSIGRPSQKGHKKVTRSG